MATTPKSHSLYSKWIFNLCDNQIRVFYQLAPQLFRPVEDVIPYLVECAVRMNNRDYINLCEINAEPTMYFVPGSNGIPCNLIQQKIDSANLQCNIVKTRTIADLFAAFWNEVIDQENTIPKYSYRNPSFLWNIWYEGGKPLELSFTMHDANGQIEPLFTTERGSIEYVRDALMAPAALENIFKM